MKWLRSAALVLMLAGMAGAQQPVTLSGIGQVSPTGAANNATNPFYVAMTDATNAMGAMTNFGSTPGAVKSINANASLFAGTTALTQANFGTSPTAVAALSVNASLAVGTTMVSASAPVPVSATAAANTATNPIYNQAANVGNACIDPSSTLVSVYNGATSGTASVQIVALSGSTKIYVCSASIVGTSGTTPTLAFTYGTGSACASGTGNITFPISTSSTTVPTTWAGPIVGVTPSGNALCYIQTGTTPIAKYILTYVQR